MVLPAVGAFFTSLSGQRLTPLNPARMVLPAAREDRGASKVRDSIIKRCGIDSVLLRRVH